MMTGGEQNTLAGFARATTPAADYCEPHERDLDARLLSSNRTFVPAGCDLRIRFARGNIREFIKPNNERKKHGDMG